MNRLAGICMLVLLLACPQVMGQETTETQSRVNSVVQAANDLLAKLDDQQRQQLVFDFDDQKQRVNWSNLPQGIVRRQGLRMGELTAEQRDAVMKIIEATMSERGYRQVVDNMHADEILRRGVAERGGRNQPDFGQAAYYVSFLGKPSLTQPWMWQFGGHHLAINATILGDQITLAPSLTGGQPIRYEWDGQEIVQMKRETQRAFQLVGALSAEQLAKAKLSDEPANMIYGPGNEDAKPKQEGIPASELNPKQQDLLLKLIEDRIGILNPVHTQAEMKNIRDHLDKTWFAWFGSTKAGEPASYRIQGPSVLIEFSPQELGGDPTQHTHAMYRNPLNDYGKAWTK